MKSKELSTMSSADLKLKIIEMKKELIKMNSQVATGTNTKKPSDVKNTKKNIARILTLLQKRGEKTA